MPIVKPVNVAPFFILSEIQSSSNDDCILCLLTSQEVTVLRQALFPVAYWRTRLGEKWGFNHFEYTENNDDKTFFRELIDTIDYKLSGGMMTTCFDDIKVGLEAIADAIAGLQLSVTNNNACGGCSCAAAGGIVTQVEQPEIEEITESNPPPTMQVPAEPNPVICNRINYVIDNVGAAIHDLYVLGADRAINNGIQVIISYLAIAAAKNQLMAYQLYAVAGYLESIAVFFGANMSLSHMDDVFNDPDVKEEIVCAWYNQPGYDVALAQSDLDLILGNAGMTEVEKAVTLAIAGVFGLSIIWFEQSGTYPIDAEMDSYTGGIDCAVCSEDPGSIVQMVIYDNIGTNLDLEAPNPAGPIPIQSVHRTEGWDRHQIYVCWATPVNVTMDLHGLQSDMYFIVQDEWVNPGVIGTYYEGVTRLSIHVWHATSPDEFTVDFSWVDPVV